MQFLALPFHVAFPLLLCRGCILVLEPEDAHTLFSRLVSLWLGRLYLLRWGCCDGWVFFHASPFKMIKTVFRFYLFLVSSP
jgi:hypothetical protein